MQNNVSNISFKSNIRFISSMQYEKLLSAMNPDITGEIWDLKDVKKVADSAATEKIRYCLAGVLNNLSERKDYIFHWLPKKMFENLGFGAEQNNLKEIGQKLQQISKTDKLKGFVIGGMSKQYSEMKGKISSKLFNFFDNLLTSKQKNKFTIFFAQNIKNNGANWPETAFIYDKVNDTYYVRCKHNGLNLWHDITDKAEIKKYFDYIHIANEDKVFVGLDSKEPIPNDFWNKNELEKSA